jgi:V/A-type H+-transporting ATPase subunit E
VGLDAILEAIEQSGQASVRAIEERTREEIARMVSEAEREADSIREDARKTASSAVTADRARTIHQARLEAMQIVGDAEQMIVEQALERVRTRLAEFRATPDYPEFLRDLTQEVLAAVQGSMRKDEQVHLHADPRDKVLLENILGGIGLNLPVSYELTSWGGVCATSADQRVVVDNTLEARLTNATPHLQRLLPTLLRRNPDSGLTLYEPDNCLQTSEDTVQKNSI